MGARVCVGGVLLFALCELFLRFIWRILLGMLGGSGGESCVYFEFGLRCWCAEENCFQWLAASVMVQWVLREVDSSKKVGEFTRRTYSDMIREPSRICGLIYIKIRTTEADFHLLSHRNQNQSLE